MAKRRTTGTAPADGDDLRAFRAAVRDVKPLSHAGAVTSSRPPRARPLPAQLREQRRAQPLVEDLDATMPLLPSTAADDPAARPALVGGDALAFRRSGVRDQVLRRLRRGLIPVEAQLDLHGLNQAAARAQLADFLVHCDAAGVRCARIIHGKGSRSGARGPILKIAVDSWLRRHHGVLAFTSAKAIDGGTGALYVLLRG